MLIRYLTVALVLFLSLAVPLLLPPSNVLAAPAGAVVQTSYVNAKSDVLTVTILNTSHKEISAISLLVRVNYPDGTAGTWEYGGDYLPFMIATIEEGHPIAPYPGNGAPQPGATFTLDVPLGQQQVQTASATVDVVVYSDGTADVLNDQMFEIIASQRKGRVLGYQKANELLSSALADPKDQHPSITVAAQLRTLAKQYETNPPPGGAYEGVGLLDAATNISNAPKSPTGRSEREDAYLRTRIKIHQNRISLTLPHTHLTEEVLP